MHDEHGHPIEPQPGEGDGGGKGWKIAAGIAVLAALVALGALASLLFLGDSNDGESKGGDVRACVPSHDFTKTSTDKGDVCPPKDAKQMDGLVQKTKAGSFTIQVIDGKKLGKVVKLYVREPDRPYIDVQHAQTHAALGQPIRVYTKQIDGKESVVYMEDAPLLQ
jgi:hypothetical protein